MPFLASGRALVAAARRITFVGLAIFASACAGGGGGESAAPLLLPGDEAPAAQIWTRTLTGSASTPFRFFGEGADPDGGPVTFAWDFDGDGVVDSTAQSPLHVFGTTGEFEVRLTVTDDEGSSSDAFATVVVASGPSPTGPAAVVRALSLTGAPPYDVHFLAEATDPDGGGIALYQWDFDSDGVIDASGPALDAAATTYATDGAHAARVTVTDGEGETAVAVVVVSLCEPGTVPDEPPSAVIVSLDSPAGPAPHTMTLTAVGTDIEGGPSSVAWDLDGDGVFGDVPNVSGSSSDRVVTHSFAAGAHAVRLSVTDADGDDSIAQIAVIANDGTVTAPSAHAFADAVDASPGAPIQFHGVASSPVGLPVTLEWDFDGDGVIDSTLPDPTFMFTTPGLYAPMLIATDSAGAASTSVLTVAIQKCLDALGGGFVNYKCPRVKIPHGGAGALVMTPRPGSAAATVATNSGVLGPMGLFGDPRGNDIVVGVPGGGPPVWTVAVSSKVKDGPYHVSTYIVYIRLSTPGVGVQICHCPLTVVHDDVH